MSRLNALMQAIADSQRNTQVQMVEILSLLKQQNNDDIDTLVACLESGLEQLELKLGDALLNYRAKRQELLQNTLEQIEDINQSPLVATVSNGNGAVSRSK